MHEAEQRRAFADEVIANLQKSGRAGPLTYDAERFEIEAPNERIVLGHLYAQCRDAPATARAVLMQRFTEPRAATPQTRDELLACVRPMLRDRAWLEHYAIEHRQMFGELLGEPLPHALVSEHHVVTLVAWNIQSMATVTWKTLRDLGVSEEEAFVAAGKNLRAIPTDFRELRRGLWASVQEDDFDASRLLIKRARQLGVRGAPVAVAANRNALFITGDADEENLEALAVVAEKQLRQPRRLAPLLLRYGDEGWEPWLPPLGSKLRPRFRGWELQAAMDRYNQQKAALEDLEQRVGAGAHPLEGYFYASLQHDDRGQTFAMWFPIPILLPKCELLGIRAKENGPIVRVKWDDALLAMGGRMQKLDAYPERWRVEPEGFPTEAERRNFAMLA